MKDVEEFVNNLYSKDQYIIQNPSIHEEDSSWKVSKIIPLIDRFINQVSKEEINLLDVGGGAGLILKAVSTYIDGSHHIRVNKFGLDLSPGMLEIQKKNNPDMKRSLNEDIRRTSMDNKEIDLVLLIDVLEHVPHAIEALEELKRISNFVIFKVPLENNLSTKMWNLLKKDEQQKRSIETLGHLNFYSFSQLKQQIERYTGLILGYSFTNYFRYLRNSEHYRENRRFIGRLTDFVALHLFKLSPKLCSTIFTDFVMILVKCY